MRSTGFIGVVTAVLACYSPLAFGAWYVESFDVGGDGRMTKSREKISDKPYEFRVGPLACGVEATQFFRDPGDTIREARTLYCWTDKDTRVSVVANCDLPQYEFTSFTVRIKGKSFGPHLVCGPDKGL